MILALLPILAFGAIFWFLAARWPEMDRRRVVARSAVLWGAYLVLGTELLSLGRLLTRGGLAAWWSLPILLGLARWQFAGRVGFSWFRYRSKERFYSTCESRNRDLKATLREYWPRWRLPAAWGERLILLGIAAVFAITALVAWITPPQTWDSLAYHMPRVARWAQDRAVHHYATGILAQNANTPGAEIVILNFYVLAQSDRLANFVEWFSMAGCVILASLAAKQLGAGVLGQALAATITASIPMGVVQASSTMTDYVAAFWVLCAAVEVLDGAGRQKPLELVTFSALAAGLAWFTKPTALVYLLPLAVVEGLALARQVKWMRLARCGLLAVLLVGLINAGHWLRNYHAFGNFLSDSSYTQAFANELFTPQVITSNLIRNAALHAGLPWGRANKLIYETVVAIHEKLLHLSVDDPRTTTAGPYPWMSIKTHEDMVGNPLHALLALVSVGAVLAGRKRFGAASRILALVVVSGFVLFSVVFKWQVFGSRYHMSFFVLAAPLGGYVLEWLLPRRLALATGLLLIVAAWPWLFSINSRPMIPNNRATVQSILVEPRYRLYFANGMYLYKPYEDITNTIKDAHCDRAWLSLSGAQAEYPLWVMLGAPFSGRRIAWSVTTPGQHYPPEEFQPCAVICDHCTEESYLDLPLVYQYDMISLYLTK